VPNDLLGNVWAGCTNRLEQQAVRADSNQSSQLECQSTKFRCTNGSSPSFDCKIKMGFDDQILQLNRQSVCKHATPISLIDDCY